MSKQFYITWDIATQSYVMASAYSKVFVEAFKNIIPIGARHWDGTKKLWYITEPYGDALRALIIQSFGKENLEFRSRAEVEAQQQRATAAVAPIDGIGKACLDFISCLEYDEAKSLYRKALMRLHPDRGGKPEDAAKLNDSWRKLEKEVFKK